MTKITDLFKKNLPALLTLVVSIYPVFFLYIQNARDMLFYEALIAMGILAVCGIAVYVLFYVFALLIKKNAHAKDISPSVCSGLISSAVMAILLNVNIVRSLTSDLFDRPGSSRRVIVTTLAICFFAILICSVIVILLSKKQGEFLLFISKVLIMVVCGLMLVNIITSVPGMISANKDQESYDDNSPLFTGMDFENIDLSNRPNVYFILLDEYMDFNSIEEYYGFDNAVFESFLKENNFNISYSSKGLALGGTHIQFANLCSLEKVRGRGTQYYDCYQFMEEEAPLFTAWRALGYSQRQVSSEDEFIPVTSYFDTAKGFSSLFKSQTESGRNILDLVTENSVLYEFNRFFRNFTAGDYNAEKAMHITDVFDYYTNEEFIKTDSPIIHYSYVGSPHIPFFFHADGTLTEAEGNCDWTVPEKYLEQYKFITVKTQETIEAILENDPNSIIIIQSDHGVRAAPHVPYEESIKIFNAVYCGGEELDIEGLSAVDTFRLILTVCGLECELLGYPEE